jgi:hypothetical protein
VNGLKDPVTLKQILAIGFFVFAAIFSGKLTLAQSLIVPARGAACPSGTNNVGAGYCRAQDSRGYLEANGSLCPSGTHNAGAGYCKVEGSQVYVGANGSVCPSGTQNVGAGYCRTN